MIKELVRKANPERKSEAGMSQVSSLAKQARRVTQNLLANLRDGA